jgi:hypothetical protein
MVSGSPAVRPRYRAGAGPPPAIFAATASARLHVLGIRSPGATIALVGGPVAAAFRGGPGSIARALAERLSASDVDR